MGDDKNKNGMAQCSTTICMKAEKAQNKSRIFQYGAFFDAVDVRLLLLGIIFTALLILETFWQLCNNAFQQIKKYKEGHQIVGFKDQRCTTEQPLGIEAEKRKTAYTNLKDVKKLRAEYSQHCKKVKSLSIPLNQESKSHEFWKKMFPPKSMMHQSSMKVAAEPKRFTKKLQLTGKFKYALKSVPRHRDSDKLQAYEILNNQLPPSFDYGYVKAAFANIEDLSNYLRNETRTDVVGRGDENNFGEIHSGSSQDSETCTSISGDYIPNDCGSESSTSSRNSSSVSEKYYRPREKRYKQSHFRWHLARFYLSEQAHEREKGILVYDSSDELHIIRRSKWRKECASKVRCNLPVSDDNGGESDVKSCSKERRKSRRLVKNNPEARQYHDLSVSSHESTKALPLVLIRYELSDFRVTKALTRGMTRYKHSDFRGTKALAHGTTCYKRLDFRGTKALARKTTHYKRSDFRGTKARGMTCYKFADSRGSEADLRCLTPLSLEDWQDIIIPFFIDLPDISGKLCIDIELLTEQPLLKGKQNTITNSAHCSMAFHSKSGRVSLMNSRKRSPLRVCYTRSTRSSSCSFSHSVEELVGIGDSLKPYREKRGGLCCPRHITTHHLCSNVKCKQFENGVGSGQEKIFRVEEGTKLSLVNPNVPATVAVAAELQQTSKREEKRFVHNTSFMEDPVFQAARQLLHARAFSKVIETVEPALSVSDHLSGNNQQIRTVALLFVIGLAHLKLDNYSEAQHYFNRAQNLCNPIDGKANMGLCDIYLGDIEFASQNFQKAAKHYSTAIRLYNTENVAVFFHMVPPSISAVYSKLGSAFRKDKKMVDAVQAYMRAIETAITDKDRLAAHTSLGNLYQSLGENSSALAHYEEAIKLSEKLGDYISLGWAHGNLGNAYLGLFQKDKALHHLQKSLDLTVEYEPTPQAIGRTYNNLGTAYQSLGELDRAQEHYDLALSQAVYGNDIAGQSRVLGNIGNVFMLRKKYSEAIPHYAEVLRVSKDRSTVSTAHHNRGCAYYEWAEAKMEALSGAKKGHLCYFHGPGFEDDPRPVVIPEIATCYCKGRDDLQEVVQYHEENLDNIKGSPKGLNLSISLFETNSRTFHRLQDCLVNLGEYTQALLVAEQSRARTLGELMLKRKGWSLPIPLNSPLQFEQIVATIANRTHPVLYLSYTGARLLGWVFVPQDGDVHMSMFEVPLSDDQFDGKSFDYHLRYSLTELLVERSFEMYRGVEYDDDSSKPVQNLYNLIAEPLVMILEKFTTLSDVHKILVISDSYTALLPYSCLHHPEKGFLGDEISFQLMPSLLTMSVLDQLPDANVVHLPEDTYAMCIAGNPTIPPFILNKEVWNLGKLPHAGKEAEWVAHIIKTTPILEDQATKSAVLMRIQSAKVIHLATHGSASSGFLAFGAMVSVGLDVAVDAQSVLLYPQDIEQLNISPALVVLSSCDSGRGTMKADGIQGMARAFILAGAQAVLTTLWRVPDESAAIFMQFFYQYMMDGMESTLALRKAILSVRCFSKYSQYIHWSGYQLTGRDVYFQTSTPSATQLLTQRLGAGTVFPRLSIVKALESALVKDPCYPTDVQILQGCPGVKSSEVVVDFIHTSHQYFIGGIFWINCRSREFIAASIYNIEKVLQINLEDVELTELRPVLLVFDGLTTLPGTEVGDSSSNSLLKLMSSRHAHCVILYKHYLPPDKLIRSIDQNLVRGSKIHTIESLSKICSTQRIVYTLQRQVDLAPNNSDQKVLDNLAEFTSGSPVLVDITSQLILSKFRKEGLVCSQDESTTKDLHSKLTNFAKSINLKSTRQSREVKGHQFNLRNISQNMMEKIPSVATITEEQRDEWDTRTTYDSWESLCDIVNSAELLLEEQTLLYCLSIFGCCPVPTSLVTSLSSIITTTSGQPHLTSTLLHNLIKKSFILTYPSPVVMHPSLSADAAEMMEGEKFVYMPQYLANYLWKSLDDRDRAFALATSYHTLSSLSSSCPQYSPFLLGLVKLLLDAVHLHSDLKDCECYKEVYRLYVKLVQLPQPEPFTQNLQCPQDLPSISSQHCHAKQSDSTARSIPVTSL